MSKTNPRQRRPSRNESKPDTKISIDDPTETIENILIASEARQNAHSSIFEASVGNSNQSGANRFLEENHGGPLSSNEIYQLSRLCTAILSSQTTCSPDSDHGFGVVDGHLLNTLFPLLEKHVVSASSVDLVSEACRMIGSTQSEHENGMEAKKMMEQWLSGVSSLAPSFVGAGYRLLVVIKNGLESASILLSIMTSQGVDRRVVSEDCIEACIALIRQHLMKNVIPAITNTGHIMVAQVHSSKVAETSPPSAKKQKRSSGVDKEQLQAMHVMKNLHYHILSTVGLLLVLMERMETLLRSVPLDDRPLLTLCSTALTTFTTDPSSSPQSKEVSTCHLLHVASIGLITTIFRKYSQHRTIILEDLFPTMLKLPSSKRSLRTFTIDAESESRQLAVKRSLFSPSGFGGEEKLCIQALTALVLSLIQSCVEMPTSAVSNEQGKIDVGLNQSCTRLQSGLAQCQSVCNFFSVQLLRRCSRKGEEGGASEFRPVLANLVDDLLLLQLSPEHPAAEMLLFSLYQILSNDVVKASSIGPTSPNSSSVESTYLATAFDTLGKIGAAVAKTLAAYREQPLQISRSERGGEDDKEVSRCHCGRRSLVETFMVNCDDCHGWFHGECVGMTKERLSRIWLCDDCQLKKIVIEETRAFAQRTSCGWEQDVGDTHVFRQLVQNHLSNLIKTTNSVSIGCAREFLLAQWIEELDDSRGRKLPDTADLDENVASSDHMFRDHFLDQWDVHNISNGISKGKYDSSECARPSLNKEGMLRIMRSLVATKSDLARSFPHQLGLLVQLMADEACVSLRKLAVKAISQIVEADPKLMIHPVVKKAVSQRFRDDAKSVREAAVALVGSFVVQTPEVANAFHSSLLPCLTDEGVSVKKRTVKIFRDILLSNPSYTGRAQACAVMLQRAADVKEDDSVRDLIHEFFTELWLEAGSLTSPEERQVRLQPVSTLECTIQATEAEDSNMIQLVTGAGVVTPLTPGGSRAIGVSPDLDREGRKSSTRLPQLSRSHVAAAQMVEVVMAAGNKEMLTTLMKKLIFGLSDADKDRKAVQRQEKKEAICIHCSQLADALVEQLFRAEEKRSDVGSSFGNMLVAIIRTIGVIAEVAPAEILRHVDTLLPFLKADNGVSQELESWIVSDVADIVFRITPIMTKGDILRLGSGSVCDDLIRITYRFGSTALSSAVRALSVLAYHEETERNSSVIAKKLMKLVTTFYGYLMKNKASTDDISACTANTRNNVHRALSVLGNFCRNHDINDEEWRSDDEEDMLEISPQALSWSNVANACYDLFAEYLQKDDAETKCASLRAMTGIFMSRPRVMLMLEHDGTIEDVMSQASPQDLQLESLKCWRDILLAEEHRVESGDAKAKMDANEGVSVSQQISGDQDGDATIVGGVLTQHSTRLFEMTTSQDERIRFAAVDLLGNLLRQGLLNPMETVPYLFALQGDVRAPIVRSLARRLLIAEGEKRPDMLRQRVCAGVKQAYRFQLAVYPAQDVTAVVTKKRGAHVEVESIFAQVFKECIRNSKKQRQGLYRNLLGLFDIDNAMKEQSGPLTKTSMAPVHDSSILSFASQVLAHLPYNAACDPLFLIYHISGMTALQGAQLLDRFVSFLSPYGLSASSELDEHNMEQDALERASQRKSPRRNKEVAAVNAASFDLFQFSELCYEASALVLLLRLKAYLRKTYNLSETRCLEYSPEAKERISDKGISIPAVMPIFDSSIPIAYNREAKNHSKAHFNKDGLILQYAEFRRLMRAELSADMRIGESDDESSKRKRKDH